MASQGCGDGVAGGVIGDIGHHVLADSDFLQHSIIGGDIISLGSADDDLCTIFGSLDCLLEISILGLLPLENKLFVNRHNGQDTEIGRAVLCILDHGH